mgnify:CR=1 FL=1
MMYLASSISESVYRHNRKYYGLACKFEVSTRTIYRDFDSISAAGIPIYAAQGKGGGISLEESSPFLIWAVTASIYLAL